MSALLRWPALAALVIGVTVNGPAWAQPSAAEDRVAVSRP